MLLITLFILLIICGVLFYHLNQAKKHEILLQQQAKSQDNIDILLSEDDNVQEDVVEEENDSNFDDAEDNESVSNGELEHILHANDDSITTTESDREVKLQTEDVQQSITGDDLLTIYVMAKGDNSFVGYELLQALLSVGVRYGKMNIFHMYKDGAEVNDDIIFSIARASEPGIFDIENIATTKCSGLCLFMRIIGSNEDINNFNKMLNTAAKLAHKLHGVVLNDTYDKFSENNILTYRKKLHSKLQPYV